MEAASPGGEGGLREGALTLTAVGLLRPHLTEENHRMVLDAARHQGKRAIEELVARIHARPDVRASVRQLPPPRASAAERTPDAAVAPGSGAGGPALACAPAPPTPPSPPPRPSIVRPLAPARYQVQMTVSAETHAKLRHAQELLRHVIPNGDPAAIFDRALTLLIADVERTKCAATKARAPRKATAPPRRMDSATPASEPERGAQVERGSALAGRSRHIPAAVKRAVWARDEGRCTFMGPAGRCSERGFLEFHHREPFAEGGETTVANIALVCRQHNRWEAERFFDSVADITESTRSGPS